MDLPCNITSQNNPHSQIQFVQHKEDQSNFMINGQGTISLDPYGQATYQSNVQEEHVMYKVVKGEDGQSQLVPIPDHAQSQNGIPDLMIPAEALFSSGEITPYYLPTSSSQVPYIAPSITDSTSVGTASQNLIPLQTGREKATLVKEQQLSNGMFSATHSPHDVLQPASTNVTASPKVNGYYPSKAQRRRESHKHTEQRRRDKINDLIIHLSKILPDCDKNLSKGVILAKACDYIAELRTTNAQLTVDIEQPHVHNAQLTDSIEQLQEHNAQLSANMQQLHAHNAQLIENMNQLQEQNARLQGELQNARQQNADVLSQLCQHGLTLASEIKSEPQ